MFRAILMVRLSTVMTSSAGLTRAPALNTVFPLTRILPFSMTSTAPRRLATPALAINTWRRIVPSGPSSDSL